MKAADVPRLGRLASLRFAWDPLGMVERGRLLGREAGQEHREGPWGFWLAGRPIVVFSDGAALRAADTRVYRGDLLAPLLGETSTYLSEVSDVGGPLHPASDQLAALVQNAVNANLASAVDLNSTDMVDVLRRAAVRVAVRVVCSELGVRPTLRVMRAAHRLLRAANSWALVVPELRGAPLRWATRWPDLEAARVDFLRTIGLLGRGALGDRAVTTLVGWADNPIMLAARALHLWALDSDDGPWEDRDRRALAGALRVPTVPLALREATESIEVCGVELAAGDAFAVDLGAANLTFGAGRHACPASGPGATFAAAALRATRDWAVDLASLRCGRSRLSWGPVRLMARRF